MIKKIYTLLIVSFCLLLSCTTPVNRRSAITSDGLSRCANNFPNELNARIIKDQLSRFYIIPQRIVWISSDSLFVQPEVLLKNNGTQPFFGKQNLCKIKNAGKDTSSIILDFGVETHGGIEIITSQSNNVSPEIRLRFGESVSEACGELHTGKSGYGGGKATNHHAMRDLNLTLPGYGAITVGNTGFRFVRIDLLGKNASLVLKSIRAVSVVRDLPYLGSFKSDDDKLNKIWETGAYTVHLCMQDYLLDGIKRDRMVWSGDMHPEMMTINSVFGFNEVVPKSLDFLKETTPLPKFINKIPSYSLWWILMQYDWYKYHGKLDYLKEQKDYLVKLLDTLSEYVTPEGNENLYKVGMRFIDWPTYRNSKTTHAGLQALMVMAFEKGAKLCDVLGEGEKSVTYHNLANKMRKEEIKDVDTKQAASLLSLSGMMDATDADSEIISKDGAKDFSAYMGYYMLLAQAEAGNYTGALNNIREFWGAMLDLGATTFWEEFNLEEAQNAAPIDSFIPEGKLDYHRSTGTSCYIGLRRSLCHGWASGPTAWLSEHVLGIQVLEPGCKKIKIEPHLGDLNWVEGTFPTPQGVIYVKHTKGENGRIKTEFKVPEGVEVDVK
ncbi:alpha-L-rhamnosidase C-terminal domain-containing protein [Plebeiibacterium marinum]|uniref:Alpha-L-rhamnosidase n=1 Tax=Plebeiibacterium marinum TaxID=2992111 RepID=A0AAE3SL63_9BACT|nr:alpha-L-rhamnosidase C-terminal domain-containing protein [Plebeiobacterium marinum]MCW3807367.1 hypothetical protein [Plebeiobacterium marinum]